MDYAIIECPTCEGRTFVTEWNQIDALGGRWEQDQCPECLGTGSVTVWDTEADEIERDRAYTA